METTLPIYTDQKTTSHKQPCASCNEQLEKGKRAKVLRGYYANQPTYDYYHPKCLVKELKNVILNLK